jgi:ankyrin repeat protein
MEKELYDACCDNNITLVKDILKNNPSLNINWKNVNDGDCTALGAACFSGQTDIVKVLMADPDIDINHTDKFGWSPFMSACSHGNSLIVRMVLGNKAFTTINHKNYFGWTPLSKAAWKGHLEVIKWMIASGRKIDLGRERTNGDAIKKARDENETEVV